MTPLRVAAVALGLATASPFARAAGPRLEHTAWMEDPSGRLGPGDVAALPASALHPLHGTASAGFGDAPRWIRAEVVNPDAYPVDAVLAFEFPLVGTLDVFLGDASGGWELRAGGLALRPEQRAVVYTAGAHAAWLDLAPGERREVALRVRTQAAGFLGVGVYDRAAWDRRQLVFVLSAVGLGGLGVLLVLSARFGLRRRRRVDLDAWAFLALQAVHVGVASGLVSALVEVPPTLLAGAKAFFAGLSAGAGLAFVRGFVGLRARRPGLDRLLAAGAALTVVAALLVPFSLRAGNLAVTWTGLLAIALSGAGILEALAAGQRPARTLFPAVVVFAGSSGWYLLSLVRLAPPSPGVVLVEILGALMTGTFITVALAQQEEREEGERTGALESLVAERTAGLQRAVDALQAEALERRDAEDRFRLAFATSPQAMMITSLEDGRVVALNEGCARLHGYQEQQAVGRTTVELGLWLSQENRARYVARLSAEGAVRDFEARLRGAAGEPRDCLLTGGLLHQGGQTFVFTAARDVTEARAAAAARARLEEDLRQAQKLEAVGRLAAGVAHDFNNLLTAVSANVGLAHGGMPHGHPDREHLDDALEAVRRASGLTRQLLSFTRRQASEPRPVELGELVRGMVRMLGRLLGDEVKLVLALGEGLPRVLADPGQLEQVVLNLTLNARDAVGPGGTITLATALAEGAERRVRLTVRDDGAGMDAETRSRVFEPFFTTKPVGRGTGLGLSTVYGIVQAHGGAVVVHSEPGRGSTFEVTLPAHAEAPARPDAAGSGRAPAGGAETLLVVEDTDMVREAARAALRRAGYEVLVAPGGAEALALLERHPGTVHLLLTDVRMPGMDGLEVARRVAALRPGIRVLYMTGYGGDVLEDAAVDPRDVVEKPFAFDELARRVRQALSRVSPAPPGASPRVSPGG